MILNEFTTRRPPAETLAEHIAGEIRAADLLSFSGSGGACRSALAHAVADFATRQSDGKTIHSEYLLILTCRALWATGHEQAARRLLQTRGPEFGIGEDHAGAVFSDNLFSCLSGHLGFIRTLRCASSSALSKTGTYWVLDLRTFFSFLESGLELIVWRVMRALLGELCVLWDASSGEGALGLKGLRFVSGLIAGPRRRQRKGKEISDEIIKYCEQNLKATARERRWHSVPLVIDLDL